MMKKGITNFRLKRMIFMRTVALARPYPLLLELFQKKLIGLYLSKKS